MTSSNIIEYIIFDKELNEVGRHRQNIMCHTNNDGLEKFRPFSDFTILPHGYDENEEHWKGNNENSQDCGFISFWSIIIMSPLSVFTS